MRKKLLSIALCLCMVLSLLPTMALAATDVTDPDGTNGYSFVAETGALTVTSNAGTPVWYYNTTNSTTGGTAFAGTGGVLTATQAGKYIYVEVPADTTHSGSISSNVLGPVVKKDAPAAPTVTFSFDGTNAGKLMGSTTAMEYSLNGGTSWADCTADMALPVANITATNGIQVRVKETDDTYAGTAATIPITESESPYTSGVVSPTAGNKDGKITLNSTGAEYRKSGTQTYFDVTGTEITGLEAGNYYIRIKANGTKLSSGEILVTLKNKAAATVSAAPTANTLTYNGSEQALVTTGTATGGTMQYSLDNSNWSTTVPNGTAAGNYTVYYKVVGDADHSNTAVTGPINVTIAKAATEYTLKAAPAIDYTAEMVATTTDMEYKVGTGTWTDCGKNMNVTAFGWDGSAAVTVLFRAKNDDNHEADAGQSLAILARPATPLASAFTVTKPTKGNSDGALDGITTAMEYKTTGDYTGGTGAKLTGIADRTVYTIRVKAVANTSFASGTVTVTVASKADATITFENKTVTYTGAAQTHENATADQTGTITYVYAAKAGSALTDGKPQNAGSYTVTAKMETDTHVGEKTVDFTINKAAVTVKADDKSMTTGGTLPAFTVTYTGFVGTENNGNAALTTPAVAACTADGKTAGTFDITLNTEAVLNDTVGKNYTITSQTKGALTVSNPYSSSGSSSTPELVTEIKTSGSVTGDNLDRLISGKKDLTVTGADGAKLVFGTDALKGINGQTSGSIKVEIKDVSKNYQHTHEGKSVFTLTVTSGSKTVSSFGGNVKVFLPYTLKAGEKAENVTVWYLDEDSNNPKLPCTYDVKTGLAAFTTNHFSEYAVGVDTSWVNPFTDVKEGDWCYNAIAYANQNGLFAGTGTDTFSPNAPMTRQMLWTVLGRLDGQTLEGSGVFAAAKDWATEKGISDGSNPSGEITREQLVTILWRYAGSPVLADYPGLAQYSDAGDIASYAQQAMAWAHQKGIISGTSATTLNPTGTATRAQVAAILMRYAQNVAK